MSKWYYSKSKIPTKLNKLIEFRGYNMEKKEAKEKNETEDNLIHFTFYLKSLKEEFKCTDKEIDYSDWLSYDDLFNTNVICKGDKWRYISENEYMAFL